MLRKSLMQIARYSWEPSVPDEKEIVAQIVAANGRIGGNTCLATENVSTKVLPVSRVGHMKKQLFLLTRGVAHQMIKPFRLLKHF